MVALLRILMEKVINFLDFLLPITHHWGMNVCIKIIVMPLLILSLNAASVYHVHAQSIGLPERTDSSSETITEIDVRGNERIEVSTIISYLNIKPGDAPSHYDIDSSLKALYETGFFADVAITKKSNNTLLVEVRENPRINQVVFEGNEQIDDEDLAKEISLNARAIYTRTKIQTDVDRLLDVYRRSGRYSATINPKVIQKSQNRIDLVYEIDEGPVSRIEKITFIGNKAFASSTLKDVIRSEVHQFYQFLSSNDIYDSDRLLFDQELLRRFYLSEGYADFKVVSGVAELTPEKDAFYLTFTLDEGIKYAFGEIDVDSRLSGADAIAFSDDITTESGERYNANEIETSIDNMVKTLGNRGFAFVEINPRIERNRDDQMIDLTYQVAEGPRVYIERIDIVGNARTLDEVIRREFRLTEGDAYNTAKLRRSEQRLNNLGFFESVVVNTSQGSAPDKTIVTVEVEERSTGEVSLGAGFSTTDGVLTDIGISERNLLGRGQRVRLRATLAEERQQFDFGFTEPYFLDRELSAGVDLFKTTRDFGSESSFDRDSLGGVLRMGYSLTEKLQHSIQYSFEQTDITNIDEDASRFIRDQEGENSTSLIGHSFTYDDLDNRFDPHDGYFWRFSQDVAGLGGDDKFLRHEIQSEYYIPLAPQYTLSFAAATGHILSLDDDIRINQRFFVGGSELRGFDNAGIGPRDITTDDALGGNFYYTLSSEIKFPLGLPDELGFQGALFVDAGSLFDVDDTGVEVVDESSIRASVGFGLSWKSPFGPIRIDLALPVASEEFDVEENFRFNFGTRF